MNAQDRNRAAKGLLANPAVRAVFEELRKNYLEGIAASPLPDTIFREYNYMATRVLTEMQAQLEAWARADK